MSSEHPIVSPYRSFHRQALDAGIAPELASLMYDAHRDAAEHNWPPTLREWTQAEAMIRRALAHPDKMADACTLLFWSDGLQNREGFQNAGFSKNEEFEIIGWIYNGDGAQDGAGELPLAEASTFLVKVSDRDGCSKVGRYLQGPRTSEVIKKSGFGFTNDEENAWPFDTLAAARKMAQRVDRHMGWGLGICTIEGRK